jgi:hypothetical protein
MSKSSPQKFCSVLKYLETHNPKFYQAIDDVCIGHYFKPNKGSTGKIFLYPEDKDIKKIIDAAYSTDPDIAVNLIKALIIPELYRSTAEMNGELVNLLNQKIVIEKSDEDFAYLANGAKLELDKKFVPMSNRENMAIFKLKGEIPMDGEVIERTPAKKTKKGGNAMDYKKALNELLCESMCNNLLEINNPYVVKVYLHLHILEKMDAPKNEVLQYLGNDEVSDSFLLDIYSTQDKYNECFEVMFKAFKETPEILKDINFDKYLQKKSSFTGAGMMNVSDKRKDPALLSNVRSPMDARQKVIQIYGPDKNALAVHMLIVYVSINMIMVRKMAKIKKEEAVKEFQSFVYTMTKIYTEPKVFINQPFNAPNDLTLYGNLLRSDILMFKPQADFRTKEMSNVPIVDSIPCPVELVQFSLSYLVHEHHRMVKTGGSHLVKKYLSDL